MNLRPYQQACVQAVEAGWAQFRRQLLALPTGGGKTIVFSHLAQRRLPGRTLILAHREELIDQAIDKLAVATGIHAQKEKAEFTASLTAPVVVASVQTMIRRLDKWPADHFAMVVADEAHHAVSDSWQTVLNHFSEANVLGVTATPDRSDRRELGNYFDNLAADVGLFDLIDDGYLCPITVKSIPLKIDLSKVKSIAGDLDSSGLGDALEPYLDSIAQAIKEHASFRRVLAFLPLIATSHKFVDACRAAGLAAEHVDGESQDRREILDRFRAWEFDILSNAMLLTEGFDDPGIDCILCLRPTRSRPLFSQIVGRGTRTDPGKRNLLLLDFLWHHERHKLARPAHLIAKTEEEADGITALSQATDGAVPAELAGELEMDLQLLAGCATQQREAALRKAIEEVRDRQAKYISAEQFALDHHSMETAEFLPTMKWESDEVTEPQRRWLKKAGIDLLTVRGKGHASKLLDLYFKDQSTQPASRKQRWLMAQAGVPNAWQATQDDARKFFRERNQHRKAA